MVSPELKRRRKKALLVAGAIVAPIILFDIGWNVWDDWQKRKNDRHYEYLVPPMRALTEAERASLKQAIDDARSRDRKVNEVWFSAMTAAAAGELDVPLAPCAPIDGKSASLVKIVKREDAARFGPPVTVASIHPSEQARLDYWEKKIADPTEKFLENLPKSLAADLAKVGREPTHMKDLIVTIASFLLPPDLQGSKTSFTSGQMKGTAYWWDGSKNAFVCRAPVEASSSESVDVTRRQVNPASFLRNDFDLACVNAATVAFGGKAWDGGAP